MIKAKVKKEVFSINYLSITLRYESLSHLIIFKTNNKRAILLIINL